MLRYNQPKSLENLTLDIINQYVKDTSLILLNKDEEKSQHSERKIKSRLKKMISLHLRRFNKVGQVKMMNKYRDTLKACYLLQYLFHSMITPCLANNVTATLLETVGRIIDYDKSLIDKSYSRLILQELVDMVMHPSITNLRITHDLYYLTPMICQRISTMERLEEVEIMFLSDISDLRMLSGVTDPQTEQMIIRSIRHLRNLKSFRFACNCTDDIVIAVTESCWYLQKLDIRCSRVTDTVIEHMLRLRHLVELNILRTSISQDGCRFLLERMAKRKVALKSFGCSYLNEELLTLLVNKFPKLVCLKLVNCGCYLNSLSQLPDLQVIKLQSGRFCHLQEALIESGHQLISLELARIVGIDIHLIGERCTGLRNLVIRFGHLLPIEEVSAPLPGFRSLESVCLHTKHDSTPIIHVLSQCLNVKQIIIISRIELTDNTFRDIMRKNPFTHLEDLTIECPGRQLTHNSVFKLLDLCPNLVQFRGVSTWGYTDEDYMSLKQEVTVRYPGVHIQ